MGTNQVDHRFLHSIRYVDLLLRATGVNLLQRNPKQKYLMVWQWIWSIFWLLLNTQSGILVLIHRRVLNAWIRLFSSYSGELLSERQFIIYLVEIMMRLTTFISETLTHYALVLTISSTLKRFFMILEPVDLQLGRPCLSSIRRYSIGSMIFTAWIVFYVNFIIQ